MMLLTKLGEPHIIDRARHALIYLNPTNLDSEGYGLSLAPYYDRNQS